MRCNWRELTFLFEGPNMTMAPTFEKCCLIFELKVTPFYFKCTTNCAWCALTDVTDGMTQCHTEAESMQINQCNYLFFMLFNFTSIVSHTREQAQAVE